MSPTSLSFPVPLAFDTVYFVDSPDNESLNQAMRQIEQSHRLLFDNADVQPFPFKLLCLTREELAAAYHQVLPQFLNHFKTIEFAVYCSPRDLRNYDAFTIIRNAPDNFLLP